MNRLVNSKYLSLYALVLFIVSACYGLLLRWNFAFPTNIINHTNFLQSHSHVAFLGWGYIATIAILLRIFINKTKLHHKTYKISIFIIVTTISLMLISFPLAGYKVFSIVLLSVFGITSYVLSFRFLKDINEVGIIGKLLKFGIYYYLLSSLATWFLAFVIVTQGKTELYYNTVYFYLHFLYNGYFVFILFGLLFKIFEKELNFVSLKHQKKFFLFLNIACIPTYVLSILWSDVSVIFNLIGFVASILQLVSLFYLFRIMQQVIPHLKWKFIQKFLLKFGLIAFALKTIIQVFQAFPVIVTKSMALKHYFIIGYIHLFTLGFLSVVLLLLLNRTGNFSLKHFISKIGIVIFVFGIVVTELIMFLQGFLYLQKMNPIEHYYIILLCFSSFLLVGLILVFISQFFSNSSEIK